MKEIYNVLNDSCIELRFMEEQYQKLFNKIKSEMEKIISNTEELPGVKRINDNIVILNSSALSSVSWSPTYYNVQKQAELIIDKLYSFTTYKQLIDFIGNSIKNKYISVSSDEIKLNNNIIKSLETIKNYL